MKAFISAVLAGILLLVPAANAQTFEAAPNASHYIDLDSEAGNFSVWRLKDLANVNALRAKFAVRRLGSHEKYAPAFNIGVESGGNFALLHMKRGRDNAVMLTIESSVAGKQTSELFLATLAVDEQADLVIQWTPQGQVRFVLNSPGTRKVGAEGERHLFELGVAPTAVRVSASTGELEVISLDIGRTAP